MKITYDRENHFWFYHMSNRLFKKLDSSRYIWNREREIELFDLQMFFYKEQDMGLF